MDILIGLLLTGVPQLVLFFVLVMLMIPVVWAIADDLYEMLP